MTHTWINKSGRDSDGDKFETEVCVHGSGRILARIACPLADEVHYTLYFYMEIPEKLLKTSGCDLRFIDVDSAKRFADDVLRRCAEEKENKKVKKGFTCKCGRYEEFGLYVAAHWDEQLIFTCPDCEKRYKVLRGIAKLIRKRKSK